jgi:formylmethanofuran dehydrogenase subunit E
VYFGRRRQTERKHGHIAPLAAMGCITLGIAKKWLGCLSASAG